MIYSLAKRQPRRGAEAGGGINSYGNRIRKRQRDRRRPHSRGSDDLSRSSLPQIIRLLFFLVLVLIRHHALALLFDG